jgi:hypothetical protein
LLFLVLLLIPALILAILYIYFDPFKVIDKYTKYSYSTIEPNRDYISTEIFLANRDKFKYDSFILGSSRATSFSPNSWSKHLDKNAAPFAFDASGESCYGIYHKLRFLEREKTDIKNVLILFCRGAFANYTNPDGHLGIKHPKVSGESWIKFHFVFFKAYFNLRFLLGYYSYIITGKQNPFTHGIIQDRGIFIDYGTNHIKMDTWENQLIEDPRKYYQSRKDVFYKRGGEMFETKQEIEENSLEMLIGIKEILLRNNSNYKIILSPIYDQVRFSVKDKELLHEIFGDHLYDFTGKNFITENDTNWYEIYHFRPFIGDSIMNIIYSESDIGNKWR